MLGVSEQSQTRLHMTTLTSKLALTDWLTNLELCSLQLLLPVQLHLMAIHHTMIRHQLSHLVLGLPSQVHPLHLSTKEHSWWGADRRRDRVSRHRAQVVHARHGRSLPDTSRRSSRGSRRPLPKGSLDGLQLGQQYWRDSSRLSSISSSSSSSSSSSRRSSGRRSSNRWRGLGPRMTPRHLRLRRWWWRSWAPPSSISSPPLSACPPLSAAREGSWRWTSSAPEKKAQTWTFT